MAFVSLTAIFSIAFIIGYSYWPSYKENIISYFEKLSPEQAVIYQECLNAIKQNSFTMDITDRPKLVESVRSLSLMDYEVVIQLDGSKVKMEKGCFYITSAQKGEGHFIPCQELNSLKLTHLIESKVKNQIENPIPFKHCNNRSELNESIAKLTSKLIVKKKMKDKFNG